MAIPLSQAAEALNVSTSTLDRWIRSGAPVSRRGGRGRGRCTLVDPQAIQAWRGLPAATDNTALRVFADQIPEIVAGAAFTAFMETTGPHKRAAAGVLAGTWFLVVTALHDHMRKQGVEIPEVKALPDKISHLRGILG
jgi:hypothetical protein